MPKIKRVFILLIGLSLAGCVSQPTEEENKENALKMLSYVSDKYELEFQMIDYIPGPRSMNDFMEYNTLFAKSEEGILVNVKERLGATGEFFDNYPHFYASKLVDEKMDYSNVENLVAAKTYVHLLPDGLTYEELRETDTLSISPDTVFKLITYISVSEKADEEQLEQLYKIYQQIEELGFDDIWFVIGFSGDQEKAKQLVNNYFYYGTEVQSWEIFDPALEEIMQLREIGLTFEEFRNQVREAEG